MRRADKFLVVHERKHGQRWYLPAGRVERGESFIDAACRETLEEAGIAIRVTGILRVEYTPVVAGARLRVIFAAEPVDDRSPKTAPDGDSLEARWVSLVELDDLPLRGDEVRELFTYVAAGGTVHPSSLLQIEGTRFR